jgi:hypothetical protein
MGCSSSVGVLVTDTESGINCLAEVTSEGTGEVETKSLSSPVAGKGGMVGGPKSVMGKKALPRGISRGEQPLGHGGADGVGVGGVSSGVKLVWEPVGGRRTGSHVPGAI